jgi:hypothetical protein
MQKHLYLAWADEGVSRREFSDRVREAAIPALLDLGAPRVKATVAEADPPRLAVIPYARRPAALFSIEGDPPPAPAACAEALGPLGGRLAGYRVDEAVPRRYARDWPDGQPTPGVGLLTIFRRPRGVDDSTFFRRWHGGHTALTFTVHPLWNYVRNVVLAPLLDGSPRLDAIVEEHFRERRDLTNPVRFFGGPRAMVPNMIRVGLDIRGFIDPASLESYFVTETIVRS